MAEVKYAVELRIHPTWLEAGPEHPTLGDALESEAVRHAKAYKLSWRVVEVRRRVILPQAASTWRTVGRNILAALRKWAL